MSLQRLLAFVATIPLVGISFKFMQQGIETVMQQGTEAAEQRMEWKRVSDAQLRTKLSTALYVSSVFEVVAPVVTVLARVSGVGSLRWRVKQYSGMAHAQR